MKQGEVIALSGEQQIAYKTICEELANKKSSLHDGHRKMKMTILSPRFTLYLAHHNKYTNCLVTGEKIFYKQEAVIIFCYRQRDSMKLILGVIRDRDIFFHLLSHGSLTALRAAQKKQRMKERGDLPARPPAVMPHQEVCHCVQCGTRILRPLDMDVDTFGKVFRCEDCDHRGEKMKLGEKRYCRTCGTPFTPTELKDRSARLCPWCAPSWRPQKTV